jgi:hypothetical protein
MFVNVAKQNSGCSATLSQLWANLINHRWLLSGALTLAAVAGCGGTSTEAERMDDSVITTAESSIPEDTAPSALPSSAEDPANTRAPESTKPTDTILATVPAATSATGGEPVVGASLPIDPTTSARIVSYRNGFVHLRSNDGGGVVVHVSDDGSTWQEIESQPQLTGYPQAFSNGERIVALLYPADGRALPTPWVSDDGGATWTALPLPPMDPSTSEFAMSDFYAESVAISDTRIVVAGIMNQRIDWVAYSKTVLQEADHGNVTNENGYPEEWTVSFEDGFEFTVDLLAAGLPEPSPPNSATLFTHDGATWREPGEVRLSPSGTRSPTVAAGPAGFVMVTGDQALASADGVNWKPNPLPALSSMSYGYALVGGPLGYVLVGDDALYHSRDGIEWVVVHEFDDLDPPGSMTQPAWNPSAGGAGFVIPVIDGMGSTPAVRYFWSPDGIEWSERSVPSDVQSVDSSVSDHMLLVVPFEPDAATSMPSLPTNDSDLAAAIARAFYTAQIIEPGGDRVVWRPWVAESEATCIGDELVQAMGAPRIRELSFGAFPFHLLGYGLSFPIDLDDANVIVEVLRGCSPSWEMLMITSVTQGAEYISENSARCVQGALDDEAAAEIFAIELARPYDDESSAGNSDLSHLGPMVEAFVECLTPQELNALDFD